ncbi:hypothetical protein D3C80_1395050 [compost metagenome]
MLNDSSSVRQPFGITVLGHDDHGIDSCRVERWIGREKVLCGLHAQVGGFLSVIFTRQEGRADLAKDEILVFAEFCALGVVVYPFSRHVTGDTFNANHMASQF